MKIKLPLSRNSRAKHSITNTSREPKRMRRRGQLPRNSQGRGKTKTLITKTLGNIARLAAITIIGRNLLIRDYKHLVISIIIGEI
jgi:hypothetical protein